MGIKFQTFLKTIIRVLPQIQEMIRVIKGEEKGHGSSGGKGKKKGLGRRIL